MELSEDEERIVLSTLDPIGAMATADREKLSDLLQGIDNPDLGGLLEAVARANHLALECVFRFKPNTDSTARRTLIPRQAEHRFHGKPNTDSTARRTVLRLAMESLRS